MYHDYAKSMGTSFTKPDLAIAFNSGCSQEAVSSWKETIGFLVRNNIPSVFTVGCFCQSLSCFSTSTKLVLQSWRGRSGGGSPQERWCKTKFGPDEEQMGKYEGEVWTQQGYWFLFYKWLVGRRVPVIFSSVTIAFWVLYSRCSSYKRFLLETCLLGRAVYIGEGRSTCDFRWLHEILINWEMDNVKLECFHCEIGSGA